MEILVPLILVLIGLILIVLEVLFLPGLVVGIFGGLLILLAVIYAMTVLGFYAGIYTIILSVFALVFLLIVFKKFKVWDRFVLENKYNVASEKNEIFFKNDLAGEKGIAITDLKPSGFILVNNKKFDAQSSGEFIPKHSRVEIISVAGFKITVKKVED